MIWEDICEVDEMFVMGGLQGGWRTMEVEQAARDLKESNQAASKKKPQKQKHGPACLKYKDLPQSTWKEHPAIRQGQMHNMCIPQQPSPRSLTPVPLGHHDPQVYPRDHTHRHKTTSTDLHTNHLAGAPLSSWVPATHATELLWKVLAAHT